MFRALTGETPGDHVRRLRLKRVLHELEVQDALVVPGSGSTAAVSYPRAMLDGMNDVILVGVKTAVSLPDDLFAEADRLASRAGLSRSELYARALREYLERHRADGVREALDAVYAGEDSRIDPLLVREQAEALGEDW